MIQPHVITLGTAGGPKVWTDCPGRTGISTAVVVGDRHYVVDAGYGTGQQMAAAGLDPARWGGLFITHLHSDHVADLPALMLFSPYHLADRIDRPVPVIGPGDRGVLPEVSPHADTPPRPAAPDRQTPGVVGLMERTVEAFATDLNDRILDSLRPNPLDLFSPQEITVPGDVGYDPNHTPSPAMEPWTVFEDDRVRVTTILVEHPPIAPAFAFRFDTDEGSVTISGDTCETANTVRLARDTDLLLHEAIDFEWVEELYAGRTGPLAEASRLHHYKSHTSVEGACRVAREAGARHLALHHLVPGAVDHDPWSRGADLFPGAFSVPRDLDTITFGARS